MIAKREIEGRWWPLGKSAAAQYGILSFTAERGVLLEIKEARSRSEAEVIEHLGNSAENENGEIIVGRDENDQPVTLFFCARIGDSSRAGLRVTKHDIGYALLGKEFPSWQQVQFDSVRVDFTCLNSWLAINPFDKHKVEDKVSYVGYRYPEDLVYTVNDGVELRICAEASTRHEAEHEHSLTLSERRVFELRWKTPTGMKEIRRWILALQRFLSLAVGDPVYLRSLEGFRKDHFQERGDLRSPKPIEVLRKNGDAETGRKRVSSGRGLFSFKDVKDRLGETFKRWVDYTEKQDAVIELYSSVVFNRELYINHKFLFLAQALERYHAVQVGGHREPPEQFDKRLTEASKLLGKEQLTFFYDKLKWANEKALVQRLNELLAARQELAKDVLEQFPDFANVVKNTRNYYTHFDAKLKSKGKVADGVDLILLVDCMRFLLEVQFLADLGLGAVVMPPWKKNRRIVRYE